MTLLKRYELTLMVLILMHCGVSSVFSAEIYFDITSAPTKKIDIALPLFTHPDDIDLAVIEDIHSTFQDDLAFSGRFNVVDISKFFPAQNNEVTNPDFRAWYLVGIQSLLTGHVKYIENELEISIRLFDIPMGQQIVGTRYKVPLSKIRNVVHKFSDEIQFRLTGERGINDTRLAFTSDWTGNREVYSIDPDGGNLIQVTMNGKINLSPAWATDGANIYTTSYINDRPDLFSVNLESKKMIPLSTGGMNITPVASPDGKIIAFSSSYDGDPEITLLFLENMKKRRITFTVGVDSNPSFAPNGRELAFTSDRGGNPQIYIMDIDGTNIRRLTQKGNYNTSPDWSPRGDWIAYHGRRDGVFDIWLIHPDGTDEHPITSEGGHNEDPTWARDGRHLAFISTRKGGKSLFIMDLSGRSVRPVIIQKGICNNPSWSR